MKSMNKCTNRKIFLSWCFLILCVFSTTNLRFSQWLHKHFNIAMSSDYLRARISRRSKICDVKGLKVSGSIVFIISLTAYHSGQACPLLTLYFHVIWSWLWGCPSISCEIRDSWKEIMEFYIKSWWVGLRRPGFP